MRLAGVCGVLCLVVGLAGGCGRGPRRGSRDEAALLSLDAARAWHRRADLHLRAGDRAAARADVREVLNLTFPPGQGEAEGVRLDARARLSQLELSEGGEAAEARALQELDAARKEVTRDSFFSANLEKVAADIYEARAQRLEGGAAGGASADRAARDAALRQAQEALQREIQIDQRLMRALLDSKEGN